MMTPPNIDLPTEAAHILEAAKRGYLTAEAIRAWADRMIAALDVPPHWLIEVATLPGERLSAFVDYLSPEAGDLPASEQLKITLAEFRAGRLAFGDTIRVSFEIMVGDFEAPNWGEPDDFPDALAALLVEWDCSPDFPEFSEDFQMRCEAVFAALLDAGEDSGSLNPAG
ncbi:MAG: hypothetical protein R3F11_02085 [Verrucomicrobiales bacterium]